MSVFFVADRAEGVSEHVIPYWDQPFSQPYFDNTTRREYTTTVGQTAHLHCRVRNLGDRAVSWIRKRDLHILTVGILTYTNDQRFQSLHTDGSDEWTLKVTSPQTRDSGIYECQVSTEPKISQAFKLNVVASKEIITLPPLHIKLGVLSNSTKHWTRRGDVNNKFKLGIEKLRAEVFDGSQFRLSSTSCRDLHRFSVGSRKLSRFKTLATNMNRKLHFLHSRPDIFFENLGR
ncbi:hypothetical protein GWI33_003358 [Rhynchophorus ferrugineus]|uniref:Ig-like domain-containing protein n=1 Tax=Rhynchophorus ferrugineus TaxID=354439 RepID=A0A834IXX0_RHYFE|nr:hypothetical protein GWI33_003358 [Rhynchophorus ferrugineus]